MGRNIPIFDDIDDVAGFLRGEGQVTHGEIADYIDAHPRAFNAYFNRTLNQPIDIENLTSALRGQDDDAIDTCRHFINSCLDKTVEGLPTGSPETAPQIKARHKQQDNSSPLLERALSTGHALRVIKTIRNIGGASILAASVFGVLSIINIPEETSSHTSPVHAFIQANLNAADIAVEVTRQSIPILKDSVNDVKSVLSQRFDEANDIYKLSQTAVLDNFNGSYYNPFLVKQLETDENARQYIAWITQAAMEYGLDPVRFANQLHRESRQFDPQIVSGRERSSAGALGLAQFMPSTAAHDYGLTEDDLKNPHTAIYAAANMMAEFMQEYDGDQALAEIAYNGGRGAVEFVQEKMGRDNISSKDWMAFMQQRRIESPSTSSSAWQNQTYNYVRYIDGSGWETPHKQWSRQQQADGLPPHMLYTGTIIASHHTSFNSFQIASMSHLHDNDRHLFDTIQVAETLQPVITPQSARADLG